jgi:hypothetical protein
MRLTSPDGSTSHGGTDCAQTRRVFQKGGHPAASFRPNLGYAQVQRVIRDQGDVVGVVPALRHGMELGR